ncbi:MAG: succinate dehydrogenase / fumarate reductase cytochrome b subunit [Kiritimatiellia bacterium]|jgi:succinate dehydrogenase / fumarate reductase, cytochrome b subunit
MSKWVHLAKSSVGKKWITGVTGLALVLFLVVHLIGNLTLLLGSDAFNGYAYFLEHLAHGGFVIVADIGLLAFFIGHAWIGWLIYRKRRSARPVRYALSRNAGGASKKTFAGLNMIFSGLVLLVFVGVHVNQFKFGDAALVMVDGKEMRDVYTLVIDAFQHIGWTLFYMFCMFILGTHLMHGVWSAIHSIGASRPKSLKSLVVFGRVFGWALAFGFLLLPVLIFCGLIPCDCAAPISEVTP